MKNDDGREYNPAIWERNVDSMMKYGRVEFYKVAKGDGYDYDRHFVVYTLPEGLRLMNTFSYSSGLSSGGFAEAWIMEFRLTSDMQVEAFPEGEVEIEIRQVLGADGERGRFNNSPEARAYMTERSKKFYQVWTKC
jgi:hypothetical protein